MSRSTRNLVAGGAAVLLGLAVTTTVMAEETAPQKPAAAHSTMHKHSPSMLVKSIQEALNKNGANLETDGYMGKKTREAIKSFQSSHGLKATGHADSKTRKALGLKG